MNMKGLCAALVALAWFGAAAGKNLLGVYQDALRYDTQIQQAKATLKAAREADPEAWSALLPQISGSYSLTRSRQNTATQFFLPGSQGTTPFAETSRQDINSHGYQLNLQETLFSWANIATIAEAHKQVAEADATYRAAQQNLVQRVATAYFNVLSAKDVLDVNKASLAALTRALLQAKKQFQVGLIAITAVEETQAAHDAAAAAVIAGERNLSSAVDQLHEITEQYYSSLAAPGAGMPLRAPHPADPSRWVDASMNQNPTLLASRLAADVAREKVRIAFGGHLPVISLVGSRSDQTEHIDDNFSFNNVPGHHSYPDSLTNEQIGLQVTVPIFSGGLVQSQVHQAQYQWIAAKDQMRTVSRQTQYQARNAYNGVVSGVAQVRALKQGVKSARVALNATEAGLRIGTRTEVDVLQERQNLVQAETNYAQARYAYILDIVNLQLAAGTLNVHTLEQLNQWLTVTQPLSNGSASVPPLPMPPAAPNAPAPKAPSR